MLYTTGVGAVWVPLKKGAVLLFFQLIVAVMMPPLGHGAVMRHRYISSTFSQGTALDLVQSKVIFSFGIVPRGSTLGGVQTAHVGQCPSGIGC